MNADDARDQSNGLIGIVTVIYGAAITLTFSDSKDIVLRPWELDRRVAALALATVLLLSIYAYYSYVIVLARSEYRYDVYWRRRFDQSIAPEPDDMQLPAGFPFRWRYDAFRFITDVALAVGYARLFLAAGELRSTSYRSPPRLTSYFASLALVFFLASLVLVVRAQIVRQGGHRASLALRTIYRQLVAVGLAVAGAVATEITKPTPAIDLAACAATLGAAIVYCISNDAGALQRWKNYGGGGQ